MYTRDEVEVRAFNAIQTMSNEDLLILVNQEFGMNLVYQGDDMFASEEELQQNKE